MWICLHPRAVSQFLVSDLDNRSIIWNLGDLRIYVSLRSVICSESPFVRGSYLVMLGFLRISAWRLKWRGYLLLLALNFPKS